MGLSDACSYDVIGRADRFGFQNFCSPGPWLPVKRRVRPLIRAYAQAELRLRWAHMWFCRAVTRLCIEIKVSLRPLIVAIIHDFLSFHSILMAGILPFGAMFIELFFIFTVSIPDNDLHNLITCIFNAQRTGPGSAVAQWYGVGLRSERSGVRNLPPLCCVLEQGTLLPESTG